MKSSNCVTVIPNARITRIIRKWYANNPNNCFTRKGQLKREELRVSLEDTLRLLVKSEYSSTFKGAVWTATRITPAGARDSVYCIEFIKEEVEL